MSGSSTSSGAASATSSLDAAYFRVPFPGVRGELRAAGRAGGGAAWRRGGPRSPAVWPELDEPERLERRLLDAQLLWVWLCTWWLLPRLPHPETVGRDAPIGPDAARSPRISTALAHYWQELGTAAADGGRLETAELAAAVVAALHRRFPDAPERLAVFPALRSLD